VVLVVSEIFGVHAWIADICRRLAKLGYLAIAPDLFARQGDPRTMQDIPQIVSNIIAKTPDSEVMADLDAAVRWAEAEGADTARLGVTGFCWGGRITWLYATHNPSVKAGVAWYGKVKAAVNATTPQHPIDIAARLTVPVLGLYAGLDQSITLDQVDAMQAALRAVHSASEIHVYPNAQHGFLADYRPSYDQASAEDGWQRLQDWFKKYGV
jgi:carboxymethylenebutenolidase